MFQAVLFHQRKCGIGSTELGPEHGWNGTAILEEVCGCIVPLDARRGKGFNGAQGDVLSLSNLRQRHFEPEKARSPFCLHVCFTGNHNCFVVPLLESNLSLSTSVKEQADILGERFANVSGSSI